LDHPDASIGSALLMEAIGTVDFNFLQGIFKQLVQTVSNGQEVDEVLVNFMLSVIKGIEPRDQIESMLAAQMAAVHLATMKFARQLTNHIDTILQQDSAERVFNKLTRTFVSQMEALKRYRAGGEQKITVQHVSVSDGGQAIVGNVTHTQGESVPGNGQPTPLVDAQTAPMRVIDEREGGKEPTLVRTRRRRPQ
jgi:hypothetical protein